MVKQKLFVIALLIFVISTSSRGQTTSFDKKLLIPDETVPIPALKFDSNGELQIIASSASSQNDFDFLVGKWKMFHRRLNKRFEGCKDWTEFVSHDENQKILNGIGDIDKYYTSEMPGMEGKYFEGFTLRLFNPKTRLWSLYWVPNTTGILDPPVLGSFENKIGHFFTKDTFNGKPVIVVFRWDVRAKDQPVWSQAFSADNGKTWEWNWVNVSLREP